MTQELATYEFEYAMKRLKDAIDYAYQTGELDGVRLWTLNVEESHKAEVKDMSATIANLNEGAKIMHAFATGGESKLLEDWQVEAEARIAYKELDWKSEAEAQAADARDYADQVSELRGGG